MYFPNRIELGRKLASDLKHLKGQEPIILCLKDGAMTTGIAMAAELHGWVYPLIIEPVKVPGDPRIIGVINQDGELCYNPEMTEPDIQEMQMEFFGRIEDSKRAAFSSVNKQVGEYGTLDKHILNGHTIVLCSDILNNQLSFAAAERFLVSVRYEKLICSIGNITANVADVLSFKTDESHFLDVISNLFDDDHYFDQDDVYSPEQRRLLSMNIFQYWA